MPKLPKAFLDLCHSVTAKRPKTVIDHILKHGFITTQELKEVYGYNHPPRAVRDVREHGISIETYSVTGSDGRKIAAYRFGDAKIERFRKLSGRTGLYFARLKFADLAASRGMRCKAQIAPCGRSTQAICNAEAAPARRWINAQILAVRSISKKIKDSLVEKYGCKCFIYLEEVGERDLQIDHRVPYEVGGDGEAEELNPEDFMLLSGSANRAKSWSCEHCENWNSIKDRTICLTCYWAYPESYSHITMRQIRRIDLVWQGDEISVYEKLKAEAHSLEKEIPSFVKEILEREMRQKRT